MSWLFFRRIELRCQLGASDCTKFKSLSSFLVWTIFSEIHMENSVKNKVTYEFHCPFCDCVWQIHHHHRAYTRIYLYQTAYVHIYEYHSISLLQNHQSHIESSTSNNEPNKKDSRNIDVHIYMYCIAIGLVQWNTNKRAEMKIWNGSLVCYCIIFIHIYLSLSLCSFHLLARTYTLCTLAGGTELHTINQYTSIW